MVNHVVTVVGGGGWLWLVVVVVRTDDACVHPDTPVDTLNFGSHVPVDMTPHGPGRAPV